MSTHNIGFYEDLTKIIFQLSLNTHLISSSDASLQINGKENVQLPQNLSQHLNYYYCWSGSFPSTVLCPPPLGLDALSADHDHGRRLASTTF